MTKKKLDKSRNASVANVYVSSLVKTNKQKDTIAAESMIRPIIKSIFCCNSFPISFILQIKSISHIYSNITARHFETFATSYIRMMMTKTRANMRMFMFMRNNFFRNHTVRYVIYRMTVNMSVMIGKGIIDRKNRSCSHD